VFSFGVRPPRNNLYLVIALAGGYFKSGASAISIWLSEHYSRAAPRAPAPNGG
jgi:branched-chain amino acid aminotransferase